MGTDAGCKASAASLVTTSQQAFARTASTSHRSAQSLFREDGVLHIFELHENDRFWRHLQAQRERQGEREGGEVWWWGITTLGLSEVRGRKQSGMYEPNYYVNIRQMIKLCGWTLPRYHRGPCKISCNRMRESKSACSLRPNRLPGPNWVDLLVRLLQRRLGNNNDERDWDLRNTPAGWAFLRKNLPCAERCLI